MDIIDKIKGKLDEDVIEEDAARQDRLAEFNKINLKNIAGADLKDLIQWIIFSYVPENKHDKLIKELKIKKFIK